MKQLVLGITEGTLIAASLAISRLFVEAFLPPETLPNVVGMNQSVTQYNRQITQAAVEYSTKQVEKDYPPSVNTSNLPPIKIEDTTLVHPYALVEWVWDGIRAQAWLLKQQASWQVFMSDYGALSSSYLIKAEVPDKAARALVRLHEQQSLQNKTTLISTYSGSDSRCKS